jgi:hypothetical protein
MGIAGSIGASSGWIDGRPKRSESACTGHNCSPWKGWWDWGADWDRRGIPEERARRTRQLMGEHRTEFAGDAKPD